MAKPPTSVSTATPSAPVDAIGFLQARFDAGATQDELEKLAAESGIQINAAQLAEGIRYRDQGGKGATILPPAPLLPEAQAEVVAPTTTEEGLTGTVTDDRPLAPEEPTALQAAGQSLADYYANEPIGLDPNFLRQFGAMPGEFAGPGGLLGAVNYAALAPLNLVRGGVLEPLEAGFQSLVTGGAQGLANISLGGGSALQRLGDVFIPGVKATPEGLTRDITDFANIAGLFAGANPSAVMPRLGRVSPAPPRAPRIDMPEAPIVAEAPAASRIAEVAAPVTPPPAPRVRAPKVEEPVAKLPAFQNEIPVAAVFDPKSGNTIGNIVRAQVLKTGENYRTDLSKWTDKAYRETSPDELEYFLPNGGKEKDMRNEGMFLSDTPDLALGQGANRGVLMEFDTKGLSGKLNTSKPGWEFGVQNATGSEFVASLNTSEKYRNNLRAIRIADDAKFDRATSERLPRVLNQLEKKGWIKTQGDGYVEYTRPDAAAASRIAEVAAPVTPPPAPTIARPRISTPETPAAIPVAEADVARAVSTLEKTAEQVADEVPLVDQAGNINLSKLETGDDVKRLIDTVAQTNNEFIEARRGVLPVEEVNKLADKVDLESIVARPIGQAFNAEQIVAARRAVVATAEDVFEKARRYAATGDQNLRTEALEAVLRQAAFQEQLAGATAEAGRALRMLREVQGAERSRAVETLVGQFTDITDPAKVDELLEKISTLNSPEAVAKFVGEATKPGFGDKVTEFWINGLLMSPTTHAVNVTSNALTSLMDIPEKALASAFGAVLRSKDRITLGELGARIVGMFQGTRDGLRLFKEAIRTGEAADNVRRVEFRPAIGGRVGRVVRTPTRLLTAQDELFKAINGRAELAAQAYKKAKEEAGSNAELFNETYRKYMESPTKDMTKAAEEHARLMTFQAPLGKWGQAIQNVTNKVWPTRFIAPFITTPTNIVKHALRRSPLAPLGRELWKDITAGGRARDEALARVTLGSGIAGSIAALASQGLITGGGPEDPKQKAALLATGWQPYSFKIGDTYYQYGRLEPLAMTVGMAADYATLSNFMTEKDLTDAGVSVTLAIAKNLTSKTYLQGISDFMEMFSDPERYGESYIQNFIASFTPNILGATARSLDPAARDIRAETFFEETKNRIQSRIPGLSDNLPAKLDVWGDPVTRTGAVAPEAGYGAGFVYNILSPVKVSKQDTRSPAKTEVARLNMVVGYPDKNITIAGEKYPLPVELHRQFGYASGQMAKTALDEIVNKAAYKNLSDEDKRDLVKDIFKMSRDYYRDAVTFEYIRQHNEKVDRGEK